jgi:hypothetical protein
LTAQEGKSRVGFAHGPIGLWQVGVGSCR